MKFALLIALMSSTAIAAGSKLQSGKYDVEASHSKVGFGVSHLMISTVEGRFNTFSGNFEVNDDFKKSTVNLSADTASISTDNVKRDDHLKSADFFEAEKHKQLIFKSTEIKGSEKSFKLIGDLSIKGVTKKTTFDCKYLGSANDPWGNHRAGFKCNGKISRKEFGLTWNKLAEAGPVVGDEVSINIDIEGVKAK